jgi:hypothetical protein
MSSPVVQSRLSSLSGDANRRLVSEDHHRKFMSSLRGTELLKLYRRFTLDFHADPALEEMDRDTADFLYQRGFLPEKIALYGLSPKNVDFYLSDMQRWATRFINEPYSIVFNNKVLFNQVFGRHCDVPGVIATFRRGRVVTYGDDWQRIIAGDVHHRLLIAKPLGGGGGGDIYFVRIEGLHAVIETNASQDNRQVVRVSELERILLAQTVPFILNDYVVQSDFSRSLFPLTVNTLRVLVIRDQVTTLPVLVRATQRIGTRESYPIDNFSLGGLSAEVNLGTGELCHAVAGAGLYKGTGIKEHPDTGEVLLGRRIPDWQAIKEGLCLLFVKLPYLQYCGFDIIHGNGGFTVLEGNSYSQVRLFQMNRPLLEDASLVAFYRDKGIIVDR